MGAIIPVSGVKNTNSQSQSATASLPLGKAGHVTTQQPAGISQYSTSSDCQRLATPQCFAEEPSLGLATTTQQ